MMITKLPQLDSYYQPVPFKEYEPMTAWRVDCAARYEDIKKSYGDFSGKSLLDYGCAEGYFMFRFVQDGGKFAVGVETNPNRCDFVNKLSDAKDLNVFCDKEFPKGGYDIGIYLDLWGDGQELPELKLFRDRVDTLFVSPCRQGDEYNPNLEAELRELFKSVTQIHKGYENRAIFRCDR